MKKFNNIMMTTMAALTLLVGNINVVYAQDDSQTNIATSSYTNVQEIDWAKYAWNIDRLIQEKSKFYIYDTNLKKFVSTGGQYGVQLIAATSGMLFSIDVQTSTTGTEYRLKSNVINSEDGTRDCVGLKQNFDDNDKVEKDNYVLYKLYIDRGIGDRVVWNFNKAGGTDDAPVYTMTSSWSTNSGGAETTFYLSYYQSDTGKERFYVEQTVESKAAKFCFIDKDTYHKVILGEEKDYIDVSNLIKDARFERMNKEAGVHISRIENGVWKDYWKNGAWQFAHPETYTKVGTDDKYDKLHDYFINDTRYIIGDVLSYGTAWIGKENVDQEIFQEVKNIPAGNYRVNCQGFYKGEGLSEAYLFANDREVRLQKLTDYDTDRFNKEYPAIEHPQSENKRSLYLEDMLRAGKLLAEENPYMDGTVYDNSVYVRVEDTNGDGTGNIKLGIRKRSASGDAYVDNFKLYYCGTKEWYLNAANTSAEGGWKVTNPNEKLNMEKSDYPVRYNLRRKFAVQKWNSFIVPFDIDGAQVKAAFSGKTEATQVKVSKFDKINNLSDHIQIIFKKVDLDKEGITAGEPYIIWVGKEADIKDKSTSYSFKYGNSGVTVNGPIYHIDGIVPKAYTEAAPTKSEDGVTFNGFYYKPTESAPSGSYLLSGGDMYHLKEGGYAGNSLVGTCWYMTLSSASAKKVSFSFEGENTPTAIEMVEMNPSMSDSAVAGGRNSNFIYNLSGQCVAMKDQVKSLKPGIYVCNGKKIIVR